MKFCLRTTFVIFLSMTLLLATSIKFLSTWKNPDVGLVDVSGKKVAAFVLTPAESMRLGREETLAAEMRRRGIDCVYYHSDDSRIHSRILD